MESLAGGNRVLRYLAIIDAARDFGLTPDEIEAITGSFSPNEPHCAELADAFADVILVRTDL